MEKQFDADINTPDQVKDVRQKEEHEQKEKRVGQLKPHKGHTIFKYNTVTGELTKAVFDEVEYDITKGKQQKRITVEEDCMYVSALNIKNAVKRLGKYYGINVEIR